MPSDFPPEAEFLYHRKGVGLRLKTRSLTNHELRTVLIGMWLSLDDADRRDHVAELRHYLYEPGSFPPPASLEIARSIREARGEPPP